MRLFHDDLHWVQVSDGNPIAMQIFSRHYSYRKWRSRKGSGNKLTGPGESIVMLTKSNDALFVWIKQKYRNDDQTGVNCSVFRNEGKLLSSELILQAEVVCRQRWPHDRLFTFVNPKKIKSTNPGYCYKQAGWKQCGVSKKGLLIFEKYI